jgi:hypothetical protein
VGPLTPGQLRTRHRIEGVIGVIAPALDLLLAAGDRISRIVDREDAEYYPPRVTRPGGAAGKPADSLPPR